MFILSHELAQRSNLKIYSVLLCKGRNIHNHRNKDLFESSSSCIHTVFSHNAIICWRGGIKAAALSFKRNFSIPCEKIDHERADAHLWERKFASPNHTESLQILLGVNEKGPTTLHRKGFQAQCKFFFYWLIFFNQICWTSLHIRFRYETVTTCPHMNTRGTVRRAFWSQRCRNCEGFLGPGSSWCGNKWENSIISSF